MKRGGSERAFAVGAVSRAGGVAGATAELEFAIDAGVAVAAPGDRPVDGGGGRVDRDAADMAGAGGGTFVGRGAAASEAPGRLACAVLFGWAVTAGVMAAAVVSDPEVRRLLASASFDRSLSREVAMPAVATAAAGVSTLGAVEGASGGEASSRSAVAAAADESSDAGETDFCAMNSSALASRINSTANANNMSAATAARAAAIFLARERLSGSGAFDSRDPRSRSSIRGCSSSCGIPSAANASSSAANASRPVASSVGSG
jgi:hypothetical protein